MTNHDDLREGDGGGVPAVPRLGGPLLTPERRRDLTDVWPAVAPRLHRMLRRRGVDAATAEDVVQETALRVLRTGVAFTGADDLFRWASVVGWRLAVDTRRRESRSDPGPVPDRPSPVNVALAVEQRTALEAVGRGLRSLSDSDRSAILGPVGDSGPPLTRQQSVLLAVRRHRARSRLLLLTKGLLGAAGWLAVRRRTTPMPRSGLVAAIGAPVALVAFVLLPSVGPPSGVDLPLAPPTASGPVAPVTTIARVAPAPEVEAPPAAVAAPSSPPAVTAPPAPPAAEPATTVQIAVPDPLGGTTTVGARPRQPDDHTLCVTLPGVPLPCLDAPLPPLSLPSLL